MPTSLTNNDDLIRPNDNYIEYDPRRSFPFGLSPIPEVPSELASEISSCEEDETPHYEEDHLYSGSLSSVKNDKTEESDSPTLLSSDERNKDLMFHMFSCSDEDENCAILYSSKPSFEDILSDLSNKAIDLKRDLICSTLSSSMKNSTSESLITDEDDFLSCSLDQYNADYSDETSSKEQTEQNYQLVRRRKRKRRKKHRKTERNDSESNNPRHSRLFKLLQDVNIDDAQSFVDLCEADDAMETKKDEDFRYRGWKNVWSYLYKEDQRNCQQNTESSVDDHSLKIEMELQELEKFPSTPGIDIYNFN